MNDDPEVLTIEDSPEGGGQGSDGEGEEAAHIVNLEDEQIGENWPVPEIGRYS